MLEYADSTTPEAVEESSIKVPVPRLERRVEKFSFESKRIERRKQNKVLYEYVPSILKNWTQEDFKVHYNSFIRLRKRLLLDEHGNHWSRTKEKPATRVLKLGERVVEVAMDVNKLRLLQQLYQRNDRWFVVADTKAYMHDPEFFDRLLKEGYPELRMKVPYEVMHDLVAMASRRDVCFKMAARRAFNLLREGSLRPRNMIIFQDALEAEDLFDVPEAITDSFINCCLHLAKKYYFVVLVSDDPERRKRATAHGFPCFELKYLKLCVQRVGNLDMNLRVTVAAPPPSPADLTHLLPQPAVPLDHYWMNNTATSQPDVDGVFRGDRAGPGPAT